MFGAVMPQIAQVVAEKALLPPAAHIDAGAGKIAHLFDLVLHGPAGRAVQGLVAARTQGIQAKDEEKQRQAEPGAAQRDRAVHDLRRDALPDKDLPRRIDRHGAEDDQRIAKGFLEAVIPGNLLRRHAHADQREKRQGGKREPRRPPSASGTIRLETVDARHDRPPAKEDGGTQPDAARA